MSEKTETPDTGNEVPSSEGPDPNSTDYAYPKITNYLQREITKYHNEKRNGGTNDKDKQATIEQKEIERFLNKATLSLVKIMNDTIRLKAKRLVSRKKSVFRNKTKETASYMLKTSSEDMIHATVSKKAGIYGGVAVGGNIGCPLGGLMAKLSGGITNETTNTHGSSSAARREMEANAKVRSDETIVATESVYHTDYEAECVFDIAVEKAHKIEYKMSGDILRKKVKVKCLGFDPLYEDPIDEVEKVNDTVYQTHIKIPTNLTSVEHEIDFEIETTSN